MNIKIKEYQDRLGNITQTSGKLEKALEDYKLNNGLLTQDNEKLTKKLQEREAKCFHLESKVEDCVTRLKERQSQIESLEKQLNQIQSNLEHFRETVATQRQEEKAMHEREVGQLASDIRYLTQQEAKTEQFVSELKQKLENLHQDLRSKDIELNNIIIEHQELQKELIVKTSDLKHVQQSYDILKTEDQNKAYKLLESEKNINNLKIELATLQNKVDILESQSRKNEDAINNLHNAKLFLIQENSELKATLKSFTEAK
jgi:chromosome segregation ATPase